MPSREPELYKDKIEVSLDGRQIFYLFFGGAVIVGLVFVLGVMVGRRVEARGHVDRAETPTASDPLAALDRLERSEKLSFHSTLTGNRAPTDVEKAIGEIERRRSRPEARSEAKSDRAAKSDHPEKIEKTEKAENTDRPEKTEKPERTEKTDRSDKTEKAEKSDRPEKSEKTEKADRTEKTARTEKPETEGKVRFTLQLSSFQDKSEAEAFLATTKAAGFQPYLTEADVSGKGMFYRVRLGSYRSLEAANDAKAEYEKSAKKTAQVMRL